MNPPTDVEPAARTTSASEWRGHATGDREAAPDPIEAFIRGLESRGLRHVVMRGWEPRERDGGVELVVLVDVGDLDACERLARDAGLALRGTESAERPDHERGAPPARGPQVTISADLRYGSPVPFLSTGEPAQGILRRSVVRAGVRVAAPGDELIDLLLRSIIDLQAFPDGHRSRLSLLVSELRADAIAGGYAAERVQRDLSPVLSWSDLLADVVNGQWNQLLARRRALILLLSHRRARSTARGLVVGHLQRLRRRWRGEASLTRAETEARPARSSQPEAATAARNRGSSDDLSRRQIRGSGLLLFGRSLTGLKFVAELLIVRYLSTTEYGSWTYALSAIVLLRGVATLGLNRAVTRFAPIHLERGERREFFEVLGFVLGSLTLASVALVGAFYALPEAVASIAGVSDRQPIDLLFIMILLVPVEAIDDFLTGVCAAFTDSRTIFIRRYLLNPGLRLAVAVALVVFGGSIEFLAYGYLFAGIGGIAYYTWSVYVALRTRGLLDLGHLRGWKLPTRKVLTFSLPAMTADWCAILMTTTGPLLLGYFSDMSAVALFKVVVPLVTLNMVVAQTFVVLFEPAASRLFARKDPDGLSSFYWRSAVWVAVLSFPAFALTFTASEPLTVLLFGERYASAAPILSILALGAFLESMVGFNGSVLRVAGKLRWLVGTHVASAVVNLGLNILLIPRMGALGAGIASGTSWIIYAVIKQTGMRIGTGVSAFDRHYAGPYASIALAILFLLAVRVMWPEQVIALLAAAAVASMAVLLQARSKLSISETFPELGRFPLLKLLLG
jgi:O-antigen/teichoic acid export membrane protein